jgi:beta-alanine--pyruvate transaminase
VTGDIIALSPPLIIERTEIEQVVEMLGAVLERIA